MNDTRRVVCIFRMVDGTGIAGETDGRLSKEELKSFLEEKNPERSDEEIASKVEQVLNKLLCSVCCHSLYAIIPWRTPQKITIRNFIDFKVVHFTPLRSFETQVVDF